jgi:hypothetical protein
MALTFLPARALGHAEYELTLPLQELQVVLPRLELQLV